MECSECAICLEPNTTSSIKPYTCNHLFHQECFNKWEGNCPCCRMPMNVIQELIKIYSIKVGDLILIKYKNSRYMNKGIFSSFYSYSNNYYLVLEESRIVDYDRDVEDEPIGRFGFRICSNGDNIEFIQIIHTIKIIN